MAACSTCAAFPQGCECLVELAATLQEQLNQLQLQLQQQQQQAAQGLQLQQPQAAATTGSNCRRVLMRLDHMRDRAGYTATIKQWAAELHLTGGRGVCSQAQQPRPGRATEAEQR